MRMKVSKKQWSNFFFLIVMCLLLFTPIGTKVQVFVGQFIMFSPDVKEDNVAILKTYNWKLRSMSGDVLDFKTLKNKVVLVNLWATWCPPCIAEMPSLQKLYKDYGDKVVFVLVSNENKEKINDFLVEKEYSFKVYNQLSQAPKQLQSKTIPATFLITKKGEIVIDERGSADWNATSVRVLLDSLLLQD